MKRQRAAVVLMGILGVGLSIPTAGRTAAPHRPDWILGVVTASAPAYVEMSWDWQIARADAAPVVFGAGDVIRGLPIDPSYDWVQVGAIPFAPVGASTSKAAGGQSVTWSGPNPVATAFAAAGMAFEPYSGGRGELELQPGQTWATLAFVANGSFDKVSWTYQTNNPSAVQVSVRTGTGSTAISVGDPRNEGVGVGGPVSAGFVHTNTRLSKGIVGAMDAGCNLCKGQWSEIQQVGTWSMPRLLEGRPSPPIDQANQTAFAGPPGTWSWDWLGATDLVALTQLAAWAPVGNAWQLFKDIPAW